MSYKMTTARFNQYLQNWQQDYIIYAPVIFPGKGSFTNTDSVRYKEVKMIEEIDFGQKSDYSAKEIVLPITQTLFYFTEDNWAEPKISDKKLLIFARSCDIHAIKRLDDMYLRNGFEDPYYQAFREKVRFALIECQESFANCFCASMGTNSTHEYDLFVRPAGEFVYVGVNNSEFICCGEQEIQVEPCFIQENAVAVTVPDQLALTEVAEAPLWKEYSTRCLGCGRCSFVCPTCSCFSMQDIFYKDNANAGERRRVWASCMVDGYTDMAGGHGFRKSKGDRMRFRVMHKIGDYKKRFGYHMCVGCGRCDDICPEYISFTNCINKLAKAAEEANA
ncbi:anaerobic sulfite reductase subunit AsrA [Sporomusa malonica]|uniref:Anaerobic sulfite reductase subunit A n=1 Tax=Sporomusa malonica TaxID=112901 RepID=A0A1W1YHD8_9FIRM|nr:anaerobic sulfite reductase subunit AsrA [Sporomusa malonica]SMC35585.1 anaerobic sulfite reductase subunit A [Sporomusa malonica]